MVIAHGGQNNAAARQVAPDFPAVQFVVTQGTVTGTRLSSYDVLQEESAWLTGALAGLSTRTGVVGHMSDIRVTPGLKGRAAFADGLIPAGSSCFFQHMGSKFLPSIRVYLHMDKPCNVYTLVHK